LKTPGDFQREIGRQLLEAHQCLERARELLLELRVRLPEPAWRRRLPPEGGAS
jgi:hypothetical protein